MSPTTNPAQDGGFTLIEVLVALVIFAIVALASMGFLLTSAAATAAGRMDTTAKNLTQQKLESMRNLPFSIADTSDASNPQNGQDLLDTYYRGTSTSNTAASTSVTGYSATARDTAAGDPATGPFYRCIADVSVTPDLCRSDSLKGYTEYRQRVVTQFLATDGSVMPAPAFVASSTGIDGRPPSPTIGVTVTTSWTSRGKTKRFSMYSQITDGLPTPPLVTTQARMTALRFSGILPGLRELQLEAGTVGVDGSLSSSITASASGTGAFASIANGLRSDGAYGTAVAPADVAGSGSNSGPQTLSDGPNVVSSFGNSSTAGVGAATSTGQPQSGSASNPVTATLLSSGAGTRAASLDALPDRTTRLQLAAAPALVLESPACGACQATQGKGYATAVGGASHSATAAASSSLDGVVAVLPTTFAPLGLVRVTAGTMNLTCISRAGSSPQASASATYSLTLQYWRRDASGTYGYSPGVILTATAASDLLASIPLATT
ncbi:MAG: prepilin-type N-terminal cleavage/methylation domain-containing protein, partial [Actinobacteria bacterium]|nr:prepilin-type N-terminal cleavage/methylation domain-containing protein [Actinomycetota bacterium]